MRGDIEERIGESVGTTGEASDCGCDRGGESCGVCELGAVLDKEL